jgi:hypothetical protein
VRGFGWNWVMVTGLYVSCGLPPPASLVVDATDTVGG